MTHAETQEIPAFVDHALDGPQQVFEPTGLAELDARSISGLVR